MGVKLIDKGSIEKLDRKLFLASVILAVINFLVTLLMYLDVFKDNFITYFTWPAAIILLVLSFRKLGTLNIRKTDIKKPIFLVLLIVTVIYFFTHFYNFNNAPWNTYGLFDDGAWDIFDARKMCFTSKRFELIFWDENIGLISRELVFHYFMTVLFKIFGYNLLVFNVGLIFLGFITVLFTTLTAYELKKDPVLAGAAGIFLNFMPLNFTQVYMGHRYAICGPLLMISFYFIVRAFKRNSLLAAVAGGVFAGLTMESAIMGKQYIYGLIASGVVVLIYLLIKKRENISGFITSVIAVLSGYLVSTTPLYTYMFTHWKLYSNRESSLTKEFFERLNNEGFKVVSENLDILKEVVFAKTSGYRQFSNGSPVLRWYLVVFLIIGIIVLLKRKEIAVIILAAVPFAGSLITITYDFRILIAAPFMCILITEGVFATFEFIFKKREGAEKLYPYFASGLIIVMMIPHFMYLKGISDDPNSEYLLPHYSVAVSRYVSDVAAGSEQPNILMKKNEFNRPNTNDKYDVLACVEYTYAHVHAYIGGEHSREILSLCNDFPYISFSEDDMRWTVYNAIQNYQTGSKDLVLVFEIDQQVESIVNELIGTGLCEAEYDNYTVDGNFVLLCRLYVHNEDIEAFKQESYDIIAMYYD